MSCCECVCALVYINSINEIVQLLAIITCRVSFIELEIIVIIEWYGWINLFSLYNFCFNNGGFCICFLSFPSVTSISVNLFDLLFGGNSWRQNILSSSDSQKFCVTNNSSLLYLSVLLCTITLETYEINVLDCNLCFAFCSAMYTEDGICYSDNLKLLICEQVLITGKVLSN